MSYLFNHVRDAAPALVVIAIGLWFAFHFWDYQNDRLSATIAEVQDARDAREIDRPKQLDLLKDLLKIEFDARGAVVQIGLGAGVLASLYFTYRNMRTSQQNLRIATETLLTTQKGQVTERFTRAIDQLGAIEDDKPNLEVRLGGIYALEGIFRDSQEYRQSVVAVLSAYVRQNAQADQPAAPEAHEDDPGGSPGRPREDVSAILGVFERIRHIDPEGTSANLAHADLHYLDLRGVELVRANLSDANLRWTDLRRANLNEADLSEANLSGANLTEVQLRESYLTMANLTMADLSGANLRNANLWDANLTGAKLTGTDASEAGLIRADLTNADLTGSNLLRAYLTGAGLTGADLRRADLRGAHLLNANLTNANLREADLRGADLIGANLIGANLIGAALARANVVGTILDTTLQSNSSPLINADDNTRERPESES